MTTSSLDIFDLWTFASCYLQYPNLKLEGSRQPSAASKIDKRFNKGLLICLNKVGRTFLNISKSVYLHDYLKSELVTFLRQISCIEVFL